MSLRKIASGTVFLSMANILRVLSQVLILPVMARLLGPSEYGLVAIVMPFIVFSMLISDGGIGSSLVRTGDHEQDIWSTAFWVIACLGVFLALILVAMAPVVAWSYGDNRLAPLMMGLAVVVVLQSLVAVPQAALQKQGRFMGLGICETVAVAVAAAIMLVIAFHGGGAWALVAQQLAFWSVRLVLTAALSPFRPSFVFALRRTWTHVLFGRDTIASSMVGFFSRNLDALVIGKILGPAATGLYALAMQFARLPFMVVSGPLHVVMYSHLAKRRDENALVSATFLALVRLVSILIIPATGLLSVAHRPIFTLMLSDKWADASWVFMLLAPVCGLQAISGIGTCVLMAYGRTLTQLRLNAEFALLWLALLAVSVSFGIHPVAASYCGAVLLFFPRTAWVTLRIIECRPQAYTLAIACPLIVTALAVGAAAASFQVFAMGDLTQIALVATLWALAVGLCVLVQFGPISRELRLLGRDAPRQPHTRAHPPTASAAALEQSQLARRPLGSTA